MIQRIQTVYLFLIVVLGITLCFVPVVQLTTPEDAAQQCMYELKAVGMNVIPINNEQLTINRRVAGDNNPFNNEQLTNYQHTLWGLLLTTLCIPVLALVDIFLYKKRILQARLNIFLAVLCLGYYAILAMYIRFAKMNLGTEWHLYFWSGIPLICLVLTLMATRRILKDEALVRAADRLR